MSVKPRTSENAPGFFRQLGRGFRALSIRNFRLYWFGLLLSTIGTWMQLTAQSWLVLRLSESPFVLGIVTTLQFLPVLLFSLFGGVVADRFPKRRILLTTQSVLLVQAIMFGTLVATGLIQVWHIYILASIQGLCNSMDIPSRQSFVVELVGRDQLANALALNSMQFNIARIIGPSLAGLLITLIGFAPALYLNAASFIFMLGGLALMDHRQFFAVPSPTRGPVHQRLIEGLSYVRQTPAVLAVLMVVAAIGTFGYNFTIVLPLIADFVVETDAAGFGLLSACLGIGSLLGALFNAYASRMTMQRLLIGSSFFALIFATVALSSIYLLSALLLMALGFAGIIFTTTANTLVQTMVPDNLRGRVMSIYILLFIGSTPIGGFTIGTLSSLLGVSAALLTCAGLCALGVGGAWLYYRAFVNHPALPLGSDGAEQGA
jgi:MFS family permease